MFKTSENMFTQKQVYNSIIYNSYEGETTQIPKSPPTEDDIKCDKSYDRTLYSNKKEWHTNIFYNMDEVQIYNMDEPRTTYLVIPFT
jgi:hypothetical protein